MTHRQDQLHKEQFQIERIAFFSDAVFAIAITLLIIEIKVPEVHHTGHVTDAEIGEGLDALVPKFVGFLVSFFVIGLYWMSHHRLFKYVSHYSQKLVWGNLLFLLPIVVMPFSTAFFSEYFVEPVRLPLGFYMVNIVLAGLLSYRLWRITGNPKNKLSEGLSKPVLQYNSTRAIMIPIIFICAFLLSFISITAAYILPALTPLFMPVIRSYFKRKYPGEII